jgi:rhomboid protease GluP
MAHDPQTEILPSVNSVVSAPGEEPTAAPVSRRRERSEWDPRSAPGTYFLLAVNIIVFLWMAFNVGTLREPNQGQLIHYGANQAALVIDQHQWWRLFTAIFVHIGLLHVASNMWCLWNLGLLGEPLIGPWGIIAVYLLTGVAGNLLSLLSDVTGFPFGFSQIQYTQGVGAGASGAVFGIAGILIILLSNKRLPIPWSELKRLRTSVVRFAAINLVIGGATIFGGPIRIDNSAHIGGFLSGLALGPGLLSRMTLAAAFLLALFAYWIAKLR